jgi:[acyl-carrier-protein] S-malonyltransferase
MRPLVFLFPGQSARDAEMFARLSALAPQTTAALADRLDPGFDTNRAVQLAVFGATRLWASLVGLEATESAGHSLGEYAHLVDRGAIDEDAAFDLVAARGAAYDAGPDGAMVALHPVAAADIAADLGPDVWIACDNAPTQVVLAGAREALERVVAYLEDAHFAFATWIERRIPMHTPRFAPAALALRRALERAPLRHMPGTYWANVLGAPTESPAPETVVDLLTRHVSEPVRWRETIEALLARHPDAVFLEVGPRRVLTDLLRRWRPDVPAFATDPLVAPAEVPAAFAATMEEVRRVLG